MKTNILEKALSIHDGYYGLYTQLKAWSIALWTDTPTTASPVQIRHTFLHPEKILEYASVILERKVKENFFKPEELFLFCAAAYLHDIGFLTGWKGFPGTDRGALSKENLYTIRKNHAETSAHVIQ
ncbi:MAG: hypothetical protein GY765_17065, partial [bacterium]|nr:hypothetical protein [bacterium]